MTKVEKRLNRLLWIDLEMTGLDVNKEVIIEVAAIVTDLNLNPLETYETVVQQANIYLENMDDWNKQHHGKSGLTSKVPYGKAPHFVEEDLINLIDRHWVQEEDRRAIICGNSIAQDRLFLSKYWPILDKKLHYRMMDVSSWKLMFYQKFNVKFDKSEKHRALDDIMESINELKHYLQFVKVN
jgi:oligoribonuclease